MFLLLPALLIGAQRRFLNRR